MAQNAGSDCTVLVLQGKTKFWGNSYGYDAWGNLLHKDITKCGAEYLNVTANMNNWLHGAAPDYTYDAAGNMLHDATSGLNYTWDQENRLTGAAGYSYTYDGDGNRVRKSNGNAAANGTLYWSMTPGVVAETDLAGTIKSEYIFFDGERVARRDGPSGQGGVFYYFSDHLKTASVITDAAGTIKAESDYYPWGGELQFVNNDTNDYKFTGKKRDLETGLDYFGARYYSNGLGRFTSRDPKIISKQRMADPQQWNMYSYVRNNPLIYVDPDGKELNLWLVVKDQSNRQRVVNAAPKIANDFHRWGVRDVRVHITSNSPKLPTDKTGAYPVVVIYKNDQSMTDSATFGKHYPLSDTVTVNTGLANFESSIRNTTDHELTHDTQPLMLSNGISSLFNLDHSSDQNDIMHSQYDPMNPKDPQMSQDEQEWVQNRFNLPNDKNQVSVVDEDKQENQRQNQPPPEKKKDPQ